MSAAHPFEDAQLDACVDAAMDDPETAADSALFAVTSKERANRALWKIGRINAELAAAEALYATELERLEEWIEDERRRAENAKRFLEGLCVAYHRALFAVDHKRTIRLPAGELKVTKARDTWVIDAPVFVAWAEANDREDLIRRKDPEVDRNRVKKMLAPADRVVQASDARPVVDDDGQLVPGVSVLPGEDQFSVKPREQAG